MLNKIIYILRYIIYIKLNKNITARGFVILQKNVKLIAEDGGKIVLGKNVCIKENSTIYAKKGAKIIIGHDSSTGHHTEISANNLIKIGDDVIMGAYTYITDSNHGYKDNSLPIRKQKMDIGSASIGNNVWLSRNSMVLKDANVGDNSIVAAGAVVTKKFNGNEILGGIPCKILKQYMKD